MSIVWGDGSVSLDVGLGATLEFGRRGRGDADAEGDGGERGPGTRGAAHGRGSEVRTHYNVDGNCPAKANWPLS